MTMWRGFIEDQCGGTLENLTEILEDQQAFAKFARQMIADLGYSDQLGDDPDNIDDEDENEAEEGPEDDQDEPDSTGDDESEGDEAEASPEQTRNIRCFLTLKTKKSVQKTLPNKSSWAREQIATPLAGPAEPVMGIRP